MNNVSAKQRIITHLPKLAALALVFWGLSSSSHLDAAPVWQFPVDVPQHAELRLDKNQIHVLSDRDAGWYKAAFAAQENGDWSAADAALGQVHDKRLAGNVIADQLTRRKMTLEEASKWMASYAKLPEAETIYEEATSLPGFKAASFPKPQSGPEWQGFGGLASPANFASETERRPKGGILSEINQYLHHGNPIKASELLISNMNRGSLEITKAGDLSSRIAAAFFYSGDPENARRFARTAANNNNPRGLWIEGLSSWKQNDFGTAAHAFGTLSQVSGLPPQNKAAADYWAYRATSRLGDKTQSYRWLAEAAKYPQTFYGALATKLMGRPADHLWGLPELNERSVSLLSADPSGWRALALVQVGRSDLAENELRHLLANSPQKVQLASLALAETAHMPALLLQLGTISAHENGKPFQSALYPLPPWQPSNGFTVDRALIFAIMRRESQFDPEAVSSRGACGLMQIMPNTARIISNEKKTHGSGRNCPDHLFNPSVNMDMGQKYVRLLSEEPMIGNNLLFLLAAYNGGPGNLAHWLAGNDRTDPLLFIESLPVRETHDYVQQVLLYYWMYRERLSEPDNAVAQLARGEWPRYALHEESTKSANAGMFEFASLEPVREAGTR